MIDDGSKDNTPTILDEFAKDNDRLIVFHKENGGPAAARKYGIDHSESDYLAFCDADDYVDEDWLLTMYKYLKQYNADISRIMAYINDSDVNKIYPNPPEVNVWNRDETYEKYIEHKEVNGTLWTSLFKRNLFDDLIWNFEMRICEDDYVVWQIIGKINTYIKIRARKYHYMYVPGSLSNRHYDSNYHQSMKCLYDMMYRDCLREEMKCHLESMMKMRYKWYLAAVYGCFKFHVDADDISEIIKVLHNDFWHCSGSVKEIKRKLFLFALLISPRVARILC